MPTAAQATNTDTVSPAQARVVVSLPAEVGKIIDELGAQIKANLEEQTGVGFDLSRAQVVQAVIRQAQQKGEAPKAVTD